MKSTRFKYEYRENASSIHKAVGDCLRNSKLFKGFKIYQEYPVNKVNPEYQNNHHRYDWVIKDLKLVIEVMGQQHDQPVQYGQMSPEQAIDAYRQQIFRDKIKKEAAENAGYVYITISYKEARRITDGFIWQLYRNKS